MSDEIELISDGDGIAVIGDPAAVERFLSSAGVSSKDLALHQRLGSTLSAGAGVTQASSEIAANAGRWVKLTEDSAKAMKVGHLMKGSSSSVNRAVLTDKSGITKLLEIVKPGTVGSMLTNPAILAGAAGIMAQMAMQQTMEEITEYLAVIEEKVDDVLRAQKDAALAEMIGVGLVIDEAMTIREGVGRVSEVTWSKVQGAPQIIARTQAYALRQLDALAEKAEKKSDPGDLAKITKEAEETVEEWLAVLARCFQLQDGIAILELDRVLDSSPEDLDRHRAALQISRQKRHELIAQTTGQLLARIDAAAVAADGKKLLHPVSAGAVVRSSNHVGTDIAAFHKGLGIAAGRQSLKAKRWVEAVGEAKDRVVESSIDGAQAAKRLGTATAGKARSVASDVSSRVADRLPRRATSQADNPDETDPGD